jgi:BirA family biotin operon repressor/biotin-[acetyl-CoA-carboxylase] ligase
MNPQISSPGFPAALSVINLDSCESTNDYLKKERENLKVKFPVLVTAGIQTRGRGRDRRSWVSPKGLGLYSSFGFIPEHGGNNIHLLPLIAAIAVIETLGKITGLWFDLKWPNDILYEGKKLAGILIENTIADTDIFSIVGIGINLNHSTADFPLEISNRATSLKIASGNVSEFPVDEVNQLLANVFFDWLNNLKSGGEHEVIQSANWFSRKLKGEEISFHQTLGKNLIKGIFKGIHTDGGLILEKPDGSRKIHYSGEIGG